MPETKRPLKVFLCHASQDKPAVREVYNALKQEGWIDPWLDKAKILPGQNWRIVIEKAVEESDVVIVCLSTQSVSKEGFVQRELKYAYDIALEKPEETIFLIPLRLDQCVIPRGLRSFQWVDYFGDEKNDAYSNLLDALQLRYKQKLTIEEEDRTRQEKERLESEDAEKAEREKTEREEAKKAAREKLEREAAEKARKEKAKREAAEKAAQEQAKREVTETAKHKSAERRAAQIAALKEVLSKSFSSFKSTILKAKPFLRFGGFIGIIFVLFWVGSWAMPQLFSPAPTSKNNVTPLLTSTIARSSSPIPFTKTLEPSATSSANGTPYPITFDDPHPDPLDYIDAFGVPMRLVREGEFTMGSDNSESDEGPTHPVYLDAYYIDKYEVTNALYRACIDAGACQPPQDTSSLYDFYSNSDYDDYPVMSMNWNMAKAYCDWRAAQLPTEAQWEKAARGTDERTYPWGEEIDQTFAHYDQSAGTPAAVGSYESGKSPYGVYDMSGNVWEWVADWYSKTFYANSPTSNPSGPGSGQSRVLRGGTWYYGRERIRTFSRDSYNPDEVLDSFGFRCVLSIDEATAPTPTIPSTYPLHRGEFPYCIARRFNVDPEELLSLNGIIGAEVPVLGTTLIIPQTGKPFPGERAFRSHPARYTVNTLNQTIYSVACLYGDVFPEDIASLNGIPLDSELKEGQVLQIP